MSMPNVPYCLRALLLGCCILPLVACDGGLPGARGEDEAHVPQPLAEREARHFDFYMQYRAVHDRPRRLDGDALQDGVEPTLATIQFLSGDAGACSIRVQPWD